MLILGRETGESIYIRPTEDIDPDMTVQDLFAEGPIKVLLSAVKDDHTAAIGIEAPIVLSIVREELANEEAPEVECAGCGAPGYTLEYLPDEGNYYCPLCGVRTPDELSAEPD